MRALLTWVVVLAAAGLPTSCASSVGASAASGACSPGQEEPCPCAGDLPGTRTCEPPGTYGACRCAPADAAAPRCGDGRCDGGEDCATCAGDCGACPRCEAAPSCSDAVGVPAMPAFRPDLCVGDHAAGGGLDGGVADARSCGPPRLRVRVESVHWTNGSEVTYCIVQASDGAASAVAVTPRSGDAADGRDFFWDPAQGVFWGPKELQQTTNNLTITYDCFAVKNNDTWAGVLKAAGDAALQAGGVAGLYGWAFGLGAVAADVAAAALQAAAGDDHRFNAQQTIDRSQLLDLTNGRQWTIQRSGTQGIFNTYHWSWTLTIEAWGCAESRPAPG